MRQYILLLLLPLLMAASTMSAQTLVMAGSSKDLLGAGGSQYSARTSRQVMMNNGLRTGQYSGRHYLFGAYVDGAFSMMLTSMPNVSNMDGGGAGTLGVSFEFQNRFFILHTGLGLRLQDVKNAVADTSFMRYHVADTWTGVYDNEYCDVRYSFTQRVDRSLNMYAQLPILIGGHIPTYSGSVYALGGVKLQYQFYGKTFTHAWGSTQATYDRYMGTFTEMDNHGMRKDVEIEREGERLPLKLDALASFEIGYELANPEHRGYRVRTVMDWRLRWGFFADVSMLSILPGETKPLVYIPDNQPYDYCEFAFSHPFAAAVSGQHWMRNFFVGIRFTALVGVKLRERCVMCHPYRDESNINGWRRGGRGLY